MNAAVMSKTLPLARTLATPFSDFWAALSDIEPFAGVRDEPAVRVLFWLTENEGRVDRVDPQELREKCQQLAAHLANRIADYERDQAELMERAA